MHNNSLTVSLHVAMAGHYNYTSNVPKITDFAEFRGRFHEERCGCDMAISLICIIEERSNQRGLAKWKRQREGGLLAVGLIRQNIPIRRCRICG